MDLLELLQLAELCQKPLRYFVEDWEIKHPL